MKLDESNKGEKKQKKKPKTQNPQKTTTKKTLQKTNVDANSRPFDCKLCTITTGLVSRTIQNGLLFSTC